MEIKNESKRMLKLLSEAAEQNSKSKDDKQEKKQLKFLEKTAAKNEKIGKVLVASQNWEHYIKNNVNIHFRSFILVNIFFMLFYLLDQKLVFIFILNDIFHSFFTLFRFQFFLL